MTAAPGADERTRTDVAPVEVENISVRFGAIKALSDVSFTVEPGTIHAIIGPNGAGKSTMFNACRASTRPPRARSGSVSTAST